LECPLKSLNFIHCKSRYHEPLIHNTLISPRKIAARLLHLIVLVYMLTFPRILPPWAFSHGNGVTLQEPQAHGGISRGIGANLLNGGVQQPIEIDPRQHDAQNAPRAEQHGLRRRALKPADQSTAELIDAAEGSAGIIDRRGLLRMLQSHCDMELIQDRWLRDPFVGKDAAQSGTIIGERSPPCRLSGPQFQGCAGSGR
jgi:hypothetical protein